jgi:hypothetical protein
VRMLATAAIVAVILVPGVAEAEIATGQVVLNCEIEEGAPEDYRATKIMIDETNGFVIYHFQHHNSSDPTRTIELEDGNKGEVDFSMKITINNSRFIMADDMNGAFIITKHDGRFVHAFVNSIPLNDGNFVAFGNVHWGTCAKSPFD